LFSYTILKFFSDYVSICANPIIGQICIASHIEIAWQLSSTILIKTINRLWPYLTLLKALLNLFRW